MELIIILILILLNGVFSMSEIAIVSARKGKLEIEAKKGDIKSQQALDISNSPNKFLSAVQIGITLIGILNGVFGGANITNKIKDFLDGYPFLAPYSNSIAVGTVVFIITYFSLVLGELVPKRIGMAYSQTIARIMAQPMNIVSKVTSPFIWLLSVSSNFILRVFRIKTDQEEAVTEEEIRAMVEEGSSSGSIDVREHDLVERVFNLGDRKIGSLMTSRKEIVWLDTNCEFDEIKETIKHNKHSVFLLVDSQIDKPAGLVYVKDLLPVYLENKTFDLMDYKRPVLFVPEISKAYDVLEQFKKSKIHFAVVVDEYGVVVGIVTINDIINAIVGGISTNDEFDFDIKKRKDGTFLIDGQLPFDDFLNYFKIEDFNRKGFGGFHTVAGFILSIAKHIPKTGDKFDWNGYSFEILDMDLNRIDKVLILKQEEAKV